MVQAAGTMRPLQVIKTGGKNPDCCPLNSRDLVINYWILNLFAAMCFAQQGKNFGYNIII